MIKTDYAILVSDMHAGPKTFDLVSMLEDKSDRTLVYGYTVNSATFHVFLKDGILCRAVYSGSGENDFLPIGAVTETFEHGVSLSDLVPSKRAYPESCDYKFCRLLQDLGMPISFRNYDDKRASKVAHLQYQGATFDPKSPPYVALAAG